MPKGEPNKRYSPNLEMVTTMLKQAFSNWSDSTGLILNSDPKLHYQHKQYRRMLAEKGIKQSMRRKGNCYDNAVMENFFGHLKCKHQSHQPIWKLRRPMQHPILNRM